jgi:serine/threonine protein kinase
MTDIDNNKISHNNALAPGIELEHYRIESILGHGGFGITYKATDVKLKRFVAIKEFLPQSLALRKQDQTIVAKSPSDEETFKWALDRFLEEARTLACFNHSSIMPVLNYFEAFGSAYMVMQFTEGETLEERLEKSSQGTMTESEIMKWLVPIMDGLQAIHSEGILHRDIKPDNIYLSNDDKAMLIDFGAARYALGNRSKSLSVILTPGYAPNEQYSSQIKDQGPWTDVYSLGAVVNRCISGKPPADAPDRITALLDGREDPIKPDLQAYQQHYCNSGLFNAVEASLRIRPKDRPQGIAAFKKIIFDDKYIHPASSDPLSETVESVEPKAPADPEGIKHKTIKKKLTIGAFVGIIILLGITGGLFFVSGTPSPLGSIKIESEPTDAKWYINNNYAGLSPGSKDNLAVGKYSIKIIKDGHREWNEKVAIVKDKTAIVKAKLQSLIITGSISLNSSPADAKWYIDSSYIGLTPGSKQKMMKGKYTIRVIKNGYKEWVETVEIDSAKTITVTANLDKRVTTGSLSISSNPSGARCYVDNIYIRETPVINEKIIEGSHIVRIVQEGYTAGEKTIDVVPGKKQSIQVNLEPEKKIVVPPKLESQLNSNSKANSKANSNVEAEAEPKLKPQTEPRPQAKKRDSANDKRCGEIYLKLSTGEMLTQKEINYAKKNCNQ